MELSAWQCPACRESAWLIAPASWACRACGRTFECVSGIPKLYLESAIQQADRDLRGRFYDGLIGTYYQHLMPFLLLPVRPIRISWKAWLAYLLVVAFIVAGVSYDITAFAVRHDVSWRPVSGLIIVGAIGYFLSRHPYLFYLLVLAVPVKVSVVLKPFKPRHDFAAIHGHLIDELLRRPHKLQVLDIATGTCNSLYRHGWMKLNADYVGLDLSETMLLQGQKLMAARQVPVDFVLADAARLPFAPNSFDVVLNYGALNGFADPQRALEEMARVAKANGVVLFFDEQLDDSASAVGALYFHKVLSSHNLLHRCPVDVIPGNLTDVQVHQVYQFYYLCVCRKT
jgi:ubiquinone/menaquinone biosynthesis C-methylase UbiE/uncharacterized protein YbaR (Trm112 family)